jgi:hypothetical protein
MAKSGDDADEELDVIGVIYQFVNELVMELLLDSVEAESQLDIGRRQGCNRRHGPRGTGRRSARPAGRR